MSKYEDQVSDNNRICPYCEHKYQVEAEDYSEDTVIEDCEECRSKYHAYDSFSVDHHSKPDCELNGKDHQWEKIDLTNGYHDFCATCGKCRPTGR